VARGLLLALLAAILILPGAASAAAPIQVGVGRADITPPTGYYMMGWVRSDGVIQGQHTRLWARVIVLKQGGRKLALISEDLNGIPGGMLKQAADANRDIGFSEQNVLDSASHTHAAPTSFYNFSTYNSVFMTLRTPTDFNLQGDRDQRLYAFMVKRLALAIRRANANLGPGAVGWGTVRIGDITANRSIEAHLANYGIHLAYGQGNADMDPLGRLNTIDPEGHVLRVDKYLGRRRVPVGVWSTFANHGTVNKFQFTYYNEDHHGAATRGVETALRRKAHVPRNQDVVAVYGNSDEGDISSGLTRSGPAAADFVGGVEATAFLRAWKDAGAHMQRTPAFDWRWTRMCFCGQMTAAGPVADRASFGLAEFTGSEEGRGPLYDNTRTPFEGQHAPLAIPPSDPQGDKTDSRIPLDVPKAVPLMAVRLGDRVIASVPGEMTAEMGKRVRAAVSAAAGVNAAVISGLANEYADYFTTPEEYDAQHYEGAATVYGRTSSVAVQEGLVALAGSLAAGKPAPQPYPYDPTNGVSPAGDAFPTGAARGIVAHQPVAKVEHLGHPQFSWQGGVRGFDRPLDTAFVTVQRRAGRRWVASDSDLGLDLLWEVGSAGGYTARWEVPLDAAPGRYRFVVTANRYRLVSRPFRVERSRRLTLTRVAAPPGKVALRLAYPPAIAHEDVGEPPGDFTADLTYRPEFAPAGIATVTVNGRQRKVRARAGVFTFAAPAGAGVQVAPRAVRDRYGNANGDSLSFTAAS
jgi:neutral ceramidase